MIQNRLSSALQEALRARGLTEDIAVAWSRPAEAAHGDLATPVALQVSKQLGQKPVDIAAGLVEVLQAQGDVERAEVAGPGYLNVWLTPQAQLERVQDAHRSCAPQETRKEDPVIVEYSQPNIAKPLGAHHLLTTLIGQSIANIYTHLGYPVIKWNYIGDWGTQFGKLAVAHKKWGTKPSAAEYSIEELLALYVQFHNEAEGDSSLEDEGRAAFKALEDGDEDLRRFWTDVVGVTKKALGSLYERMHVSFDLDLGESFYEDKMDSVLQKGIDKGVFTEGENGALIVEFPEEKYPPYLVKKSDGATLYSTRDIAQMRYRIDTYNPQGIYIVTDIAQKLHFEQLVETCRMLGWQLPDFENVLTGRMRFADKSMSTRKGNILNLREVLNEAVERASAAIAQHGDAIETDDPDDLGEMMGIGAVAYGILSQNRKQDIVFDWQRMLSFDGNSAPYVQYTHARARSVLRKAEQDTPPAPSAVDALSAHERDLLNILPQFSTVLHEACVQRMPHLLAQYIYTLCQSFNAFYNADPILKAEGSARELRLYLTAVTADVLRTGASILTIRVPDRM